jgi:acyl dehydratase
MSGKPFAELKQGDTIRWRHEVTAEEVDTFARLSGDVNPLHLDDAFSRQHGFRGRVVHGALVSAFISRVLGTQLPGPGCLWLSQTTRFAQPVYIADPIEVVVRVVYKSESLRTLVLETIVENLRGERVLDGEAKVSVLPD